MAGSSNNNEPMRLANHWDYSDSFTPVPSLLTPNNQGGLPSMAGSSNNEQMHPVNHWDYSHSSTPVPALDMVGPNVARQLVRKSAHGPAYPAAEGAAFSSSCDPPNPAAQGLAYPAAFARSPDPPPPRLDPYPVTLLYPSASAYASAHSSMETSGLPIGGPSSFVEVPLRPAARSRKVVGFRFTYKQSAFAAYYHAHGYLLSQVQRMFSTEFEGAEPTIKEIREQLEAIDKNSARGFSRGQLIGGVVHGAYKFKAQGGQVTVPSARSKKKEVETPLRSRHRQFVTFFKDTGLDSALTHELFELHFEGTITEEQLDEMRKGVRSPKRLPAVAYEEGWFKYFDEGQLGHVDCRDVQRNVSRAQAKARAIMKKEKITKAIREAEGHEKGEAAGENVDDSAKGEAEGSEQGEEREKADRDGDKVANSIGGKPEGGKKKKPNVRDKRSRKDKERSSSPK